MIIVPAVDQIEVFVNEHNTITIKQAGVHGEAFVVLSPVHVSVICKALRQAAADAKAGS